MKGFTFTNCWEHMNKRQGDKFEAVLRISKVDVLGLAYDHSDRQLFFELMNFRFGFKFPKSEPEVLEE